MAIHDDDDPYNDDFDLVDDEDDFDREETADADSKVENEKADEEKAPPSRRRGPARRKTPAAKRPAAVDSENGSPAADDEDVDEYGRPKPVPNYVVHLYEHSDFHRTITREFTPEEAEAFATEYNRISKPYGRLAVAGKNDAKPKKSLD